MCYPGMILSHDWRFIFLKTRKTAGTSIELSLSTLCGPLDIVTPTWAKEEALLRQGCGPQNYLRHPFVPPRKLRRDGLPMPDRTTDFYNHIPAKLVQAYVGRRIWKRYRKVGFVRNPWDREVSRFLWSEVKDGDRSREGFKRFLQNNDHDDEWNIISLNGQLALDFAGRYESLEEDFARLLVELGYKKSIALAKAKIGFRRPAERDYRHFYDDEAREIVARAQAPLIMAFGYEF